MLEPHAVNRPKSSSVLSGQAPLRFRLRGAWQGIFAFTVLAFVGLCVIFAADFWMDFRHNPQRFVWRIGVYGALSLCFSIVATGFYVARMQCWRVDRDEQGQPVLILARWNAHDGVYPLSAVLFHKRDERYAQLLVQPSNESAHAVVIAHGTPMQMQQWYDAWTRRP